jgi:hypothetical protein
MRAVPRHPPIARPCSLPHATSTPLRSSFVPLGLQSVNWEEAGHALLSVVPLVIVTLWISGLVVGDQRIESFAHRLGQIGPKDVGIEEAIRAVADRGTRLGLLSALEASGLPRPTARGWLRPFGGSLLTPTAVEAPWLVEDSCLWACFLSSSSARSQRRSLEQES